MDSQNKIPRKKRFSQHRTNPFDQKISYSFKKNEFSFIQKSNSVDKNKKLRLRTDYSDHDYSSYQKNHRNSFSHLKPSTTKKSVIIQPSNSKIKESFSRDQKNNKFKISKNLGGKQFIVNSTKYDPKKNNDLKALFNNPYESKIKNHKKTKQNSHNFCVFVNVDKQQKPSPVINAVLSPYSQHINSYLKQNQWHSKRRHHNESVSKQKKDVVSRDKKQTMSKQKQNKRSYNKGFCQNTTPKHVQLNLINKNNIRLKTSTTNHDKQDENRKSSTHKDSKINKFFSKQDKNPKNKKSQNNGSSVIPKQDQQSTVKTIKKQQLFNLKQSSLRQLQSSRVSSLGSGVLDDFGLTDQEVQTFGDRFPYGFDKIKLLGRGGFSLVWLGKHVKSGKQFAIKQIISKNTHQTHIKQIWFGTKYFTLGGVPKAQFCNFCGINNLARLYSYQINQRDTWIFYQKCGKSLGTSLYDIKPQGIYSQQKLYKIHYKPFYLAMQRNASILPSIVTQICKSLALLSQCGVVHSDLKTENILVKFEEGGSYSLKQVKLVDYGSAFQFSDISQFSMATPEYMPPQILNYIIHENQGEYEQGLYWQVINNYQNPWAVDIWSLGCVFLQIVVGVPLWMSLPLLVPNKVGKSFLQKEGLFAVKGRLFPQIIVKQREVISRLDSVLEQQNHSRINLSTKMKKVIKGMLQIDFNKRLSPNQIMDILSSQIQINRN